MIKINLILKIQLMMFLMNSQHRAWVVLGAYFIFFIVIIFSIRSNRTKNDNLKQNNSNLPI